MVGHVRACVPACVRERARARVCFKLPGGAGGLWLGRDPGAEEDAEAGEEARLHLLSYI